MLFGAEERDDRLQFHGLASTHAAVAWLLILYSIRDSVFGDYAVWVASSAKGANFDHVVEGHESLHVGDCLQGTEGGTDEDDEDERGGVPGAGPFPASPAPLTLSDKWKMIMCSKRWKPSSSASGGGGGNRSTSTLFGLGCTALAPELKMRYGFSLPQPSIDLSFIVSAPSPVSQAEAAVLQVGLFVSFHFISSPFWHDDLFPPRSCQIQFE